MNVYWTSCSYSRWSGSTGELLHVRTWTSCLCYRWSGSTGELLHEREGVGPRLYVPHCVVLLHAHNQAKTHQKLLKPIYLLYIYFIFSSLLPSPFLFKKKVQKSSILSLFCVSSAVNESGGLYFILLFRESILIVNGSRIKVEKIQNQLHRQKYNIREF